MRCAAAGAQKRPKAIVKMEKQLVGEFVVIPAGHYTEDIYNEKGQVVSKKSTPFPLSICCLRK